MIVPCFGGKGKAGLIQILSWTSWEQWEARSLDSVTSNKKKYSGRKAEMKLVPSLEGRL